MPRTLRSPLLTAGAGLAGLVLVWALAYHGGPFRTLDAMVYERLQVRMWSSGVFDVGKVFLVPMLLPVYALLSAWALLLAWRRHGVAVTAAAAAVLLGANGLTQVLKEATATDRPWSLTAWGTQVDPVSWPSGHATAAAALVVAFVLAAQPGRRRVLAAAGAVWVLLVGLAIVWLGWHMPSDAVGAWGAVAFVGGLAVAGLRAWESAAGGRRVAAAPQSSV